MFHGLLQVYSHLDLGGWCRSVIQWRPHCRLRGRRVQTRAVAESGAKVYSSSHLGAPAGYEADGQDPVLAKLMLRAKKRAGPNLRLKHKLGTKRHKAHAETVETTIPQAPGHNRAAIPRGEDSVGRLKLPEQEAPQPPLPERPTPIADGVKSLPCTALAPKRTRTG
jgi:hypothetical protein